ncbi:MAG: carbamoyltransferase [Magnetococcales bacterium]|nr:carbamoyltransferase [Magnetococcales bacterium]
MRILGLSAYYHDSAAALVVDGRIVAAAQEERFTRIKHDAAFPTHAVRYCLETAGIRLSQVDHIVFYDKPFLKFERLLETYLAFAPRGFRSFATSMPLWLKEKLFQKRLLIRTLQEMDPDWHDPTRLLFSEHHVSHAASAFYPSPFQEAAILTMDGVGEWTTTSLGIGTGPHLELTHELHFPHSLGLLYSAFTYYTGFRVNSGEYKVMGLAPYGEPRYADLIRTHLIDIRADGSFRLNMDCFDFCTGLTMTNDRFAQLFGGPPRLPEEPMTPRIMDLAASVQAVTEEVVLRLTRDLAKRTGQKNLCLAGGVALNCVANGQVLRDGRFERIWIQPAAGDAGGALGAALAVWHGHLARERLVDPQLLDAMSGSHLGPEYGQEEIETRLQRAGARFTVLSEAALLEATTDALMAGQAIGWHQGRMEFGPRALGGRSILGDPRSPTMQKLLNLKIKYRESFRPFAPSILREHLTDWFDLTTDSPYMLLVDRVRAERCRPLTATEQELFGIDKLNVPRSDIPAVTHIDYSARIQTVHAQTNPRYHALLTLFHRKTGCPVLVNTSFNVRGEPMVCTPEDAFHCFMGTEMEALAVGRCFLRKEEQNPDLFQDYKNRFALD